MEHVGMKYSATSTKALRQRSEYSKAEKALKSGAVNFLDAADWIVTLWKNDTLTRDEANTILKLLAKVKTP